MHAGHEVSGNGSQKLTGTSYKRSCSNLHAFLKYSENKIIATSADKRTNREKI